MGEEYLFLKLQEEYVTTKAKRIIAPIIINIIRLNPLTKVGNKSLNIINNPAITKSFIKAVNIITNPYFFIFLNSAI